MGKSTSAYGWGHQHGWYACHGHGNAALRHLQAGHVGERGQALGSWSCSLSSPHIFLASPPVPSRPLPSRPVPGLRAYRVLARGAMHQLSTDSTPCMTSPSTLPGSSLASDPATTYQYSSTLRRHARTDNRYSNVDWL